MKAIKFVQWSSSILLVITVLWLLFLPVVAAVWDLEITVGEIAKIGGVVVLFIGPEKAAAFFGPVLKRKQNGGKNE